MKISNIILTIMLSAMLSWIGCGKDQDSQELPSTPKPDSFSAPPSVDLLLGHVSHDHHLALYVAADYAAEYAKESGINLNAVEDKKFYQLTDGDRKVADVEIVMVGGGSKMPAALAQNIIEVGYGGVAPVLAFVDQGTPIKLIAPLHYKGDMFVVKPHFPAQTWPEFVAYAKTVDQPIRIGYKSPVACAKVIFEEALKFEGIPFGSDPAQTDIKVLMINTNGGDKLNTSLGGDLIDGYAGNNPFPAIAVEKKIGRIVCDLEDLPPGTFQNHPCCCIAARTDALRNKSEAIIDLLVLFIQANGTINTDLEKAVASATKWIGTSETVEKMSIPTSGYSLEASEEWYGTMAKWIEVMDGMDQFRGQLKGKTVEEAAEITYDFTLLQKAKQKLEERRSKK
ncbi:MAG: hypothetical protein AMJ79_10700 [Phycisphaerae bacterium SM23_30]|nr:MAG: hypothetical protein AMJ79_10700 [Phycisphaerae bacterium SM23_30]